MVVATVRRATAVAILLAVCCTGCGGPSQPESFEGGRVVAIATVRERPQPSSDDSPLVATPSRTGLLVRYRVANTSRTTFVLNDRVPISGVATGPGDRIDPLAGYVLADDGVAVVTKHAFAQQEGALDYSVQIQGTGVRPGDTVSGAAFVPLPVEADYPDWAQTSRGQRDLDGRPDRWRLCLGVGPRLPDDVEMFDRGRHVMVGGPVGQEQLCTPTKALPSS